MRRVAWTGLSGHAITRAFPQLPQSDRGPLRGQQDVPSREPVAPAVREAEGNGMRKADIVCRMADATALTHV